MGYNVLSVDVSGIGNEPSSAEGAAGEGKTRAVNTSGQVVSKDVINRAIYFQFSYSIISLVIGLTAFLMGIYLFLSGVGGASTVVAKAPGYELSVTNAAPGTILVLAGLAVIALTKYEVNIGKK